MFLQGESLGFCPSDVSYQPACLHIENMDPKSFDPGKPFLKWVVNL